MATADSTTTVEVLPIDASWKSKLIGASTGWLARQESTVVVLILSMAVNLVIGYFIYTDMRADNQTAAERQAAAVKDSYEKQEAARAEFRAVNEAQRLEAKQESAENRRALLDSTEKLTDRVTGSLDRLGEEIRRDRERPAARSAYEPLAH
jgi:hypothetical protein